MLGGRTSERGNLFPSCSRSGREYYYNARGETREKEHSAVNAQGAVGKEKRKTERAGGSPFGFYLEYIWS